MRKEIAVQMTAIKITGVSAGKAIAPGITTPPFSWADLKASLAEGEYLLNWPFLRLTDPFQFSKCPFDETIPIPCVFCRLLH